MWYCQSLARTCPVQPSDGHIIGLNVQKCNLPKGSTGCFCSTRRARNLDLDSQLVVDASVRAQPSLNSSPAGFEAPTNMVAELFEAVLGAIYLDSGMAGAGQFYGQNFGLPEDIRDIVRGDYQEPTVFEKQASQPIVAGL